MKFKKVVFNIIVYGMLAYTLIAGIHAALPIEYQIEGFSNLTALLSGGATGLLGTAGMYVKSLLTKTSIETDDKIGKVTSGFIDLARSVTELKSDIIELKKDLTKTANEQIEKISHSVKLIEADLKAKASNRFIEKEVREIIKKALENEEEILD